VIKIDQVKTNNELTIIMYHFVRPKNQSKIKLKSLELSEFKYQLDYLMNNYKILSAEEVLYYFNLKKKFPIKSCWLTFDDGYIDHYKYVFPELLKRNIQGTFFPAYKAIKEKKLLDVNAIQVILALTKIPDDILNFIKETCNENKLNQNELINYKKEIKLNRYDDDKTSLIKFLLQKKLPLLLRKSIINLLIQKYFTNDILDEIQNLYLSIEQIKIMISHGMHIGNHGYDHNWLGTLNKDEQENDIKKSLELFEEIKLPVKDWIMCYPYGSYDRNTIKIIKKYQAAIGLTTIPRKVNIRNDNVYELPRLDTNDFPKNKL